jgi:hypothetical protein
MGPIGMRRRFYAIPASAFKAFTAFDRRERLTEVPTRRSTGNVCGAQVSQRDISRLRARDFTGYALSAREQRGR